MENEEQLINEQLDSLTEILARGCLRLILRQEKKNSLNLLKGLDKQEIARDELEE
jgi:hypothetical protein